MRCISRPGSGGRETGNKPCHTLARKPSERYNGYLAMKTDIPAHILAQIGPLRAERRSIAEIAFLLRLTESVVEGWLNTTFEESDKVGESNRPRPTNR
jgi:hypothetical protein